MDQIIANLEGSLSTIQSGMIRCKNQLIRENNTHRRELDIQELVSLVIQMEQLTLAIKELKEAREYINR